jgi:hypothetical protein
MSGDRQNEVGRQLKVKVAAGRRKDKTNFKFKLTEL